VEKAVFSRVLIDFLEKTDQERLQDILPLTVNIVNDIGLLFQELVELYDTCSTDDENVDDDDCDRKDAAFIEVLKVATRLDYRASASGRNQMVLITGMSMVLIASRVALSLTSLLQRKFSGSTDYLWKYFHPVSISCCGRTHSQTGKSSSARLLGPPQTSGDWLRRRLKTRRGSK
jgi:hypothetical protein